MKLLGGLLLLVSVPDAARDNQPPFNYPAIPKTAPKIEQFVSPGWMIVSKAEGDLNRDGRTDTAIVLWTEDASKADGYDLTQDWPNYRLVIAFGQADGGYRLITDIHTLLVPPASSGAFEQAFAEGDLRIVRDNLDISRQLLRGHLRYRFRWSDGAFRLIGYDYAGSDGHCITDTSINFLTRKAIIKTEALDEAGASRNFVRRIKTAPVTIEEASSDEYYPERDMAGPSAYCIFEGRGH